MAETRSGVRAATFFILTYVLSWLVWIPLDLSHFGIGPVRVSEGASGSIRLLGVLMPATAALVLTALSGGRASVRHLLGRLGIWRVGWRWWAAAVLLQPGLLILSGLVYNVLGGTPQIEPAAPVNAVALAINVIFLGLATLGEEIGWRGVALPALQVRRNPLVASAILGILWATWHLPFWLLLDTYTQYGIGYLVLNYLLVLPMTVFITWFFNHSRASLLLPVASHVAFNIVNVVWLPVTLNVGAFALFVGIEWAVVLFVVPRLGTAQTAASDIDRRAATGPSL